MVKYVMYGIALNKESVNLGIFADMSVITRNSIINWWGVVSCYDYLNAARLMINAGGRGGNGGEIRLWNVIVQELYDKIGILIKICLYPACRSK